MSKNQSLLWQHEQLRHNSTHVPFRYRGNRFVRARMYEPVKQLRSLPLYCACPQSPPISIGSTVTSSPQSRTSEVHRQETPSKIDYRAACVHAQNPSASELPPTILRALVCTARKTLRKTTTRSLPSFAKSFKNLELPPTYFACPSLISVPIFAAIPGYR